MEFVLNPLSVNGQCKTVEDCFEAVRLYVDFCEHCLPALSKGRVKIFYDRHIEMRSLTEGVNLAASIARCKEFLGGKDLVDKWYLYTRNRSQPLDAGDGVDVELRATDPILTPVCGTVHQTTHDALDSWISFPGDEICDCGKLTLRSEVMSRNIRNASRLKSLLGWLPSYEPNPKHGAEAYYSHGEYISPMPLSDADAQVLVLISLPDRHGGCRWAYHDDRKEFYCFRRTYPGQEVYHGFLAEERTVPEDLRDLLRIV